MYGVLKRGLVAVTVVTAVLALSVGVSFAVGAPTVGSFTPTAGVVGNTVTVNGTNFSLVQSVKFNGTPTGNFSVVSATKLTAVVPYGATKGKISVTTATGTGTSNAQFTVRPRITNLNPRAGVGGDIVTITGSALTAATAVKFNGVAADSFTVNGYGSITAEVPDAATTGRVSVTNANGTGASTFDFTVAPKPVVLITQSVGPPTTVVGVTGSNFPPYGSVDLVFDGTVLTTIVADANGSFANRKITVPATAKPGSHTVAGRVGAVAGEATFVVRTDWTQSRYGPSQAGYNPLENVLSPATVGGLRRLWTFSAAGYNFSSEPAIVGGIAYFGASDGKVYAVEMQTGGLAWVFNTVGGAGISSAPAVHNGVVWIGGGTSYLYALDARTGQLLWQFDTLSGSSAVGDVIVADNILYVNAGPRIWAINAFSFAPLWSNVFGTSSADYATGIAVADGVVVVGDAQGALRGIHAASGTFLWKITDPSGIFSGPAIVGGIAYSGSGGGKTWAVVAATGRVLWTSVIGGFQMRPTVVGGTVYVLANDGRLYALNTATGSVLWVFGPAGLSLSGTSSSPVVANGVLYLADDYGRIYALNAATGTALWTGAGELTGGTSPVVADGVLLVGSHTKLYAFGL